MRIAQFFDTCKTSISNLVIEIKKSIGDISIKSLIHNSMNYFSGTREKLKDLRKTNVELGLYHYNMGNINDAISRFKLIKVFFKDVDIADYYIGRCYVESQRFAKALPFLESYLGSQDKSMQVEAQYSYELARENYKNIVKIPSSILRRKFDGLATNYEGIYIRPGCPQDALVTTFADYAAQPESQFIGQFTVLDLGCGTGYVAAKIKVLYPMAKITGVDISPKMTAICSRLLTSANLSVFSELYEGEAVAFTASSTISAGSVNLVVASGLLDSLCDVSEFMKNICKVLADSGIAIFSFVAVSNTNQASVFDRALESISHDPEVVQDAIVKSGLKIIKSLDVTFLDGKKGKIVLASK